MRLNRREWLGGAAAIVAGSALDRAAAQPARRLFDSHCHIIDHRFPIVPNQGYTPPNFPLRMSTSSPSCRSSASTISA